MLKLCVLLSLASVALSVPWGYWSSPYYAGGYYASPYYGGYWDPYYYYKPAPPSGRLIFYGAFHGTCKGAPDGLYYVDERSFAFCSNGVKTIQPCAEGSANPRLREFQQGQYYGLLDFCSINLLVQKAEGYPDSSYPAENAHLDAPSHIVLVKEEHSQYPEDNGGYTDDNGGYGGYADNRRYDDDNNGGYDVDNERYEEDNGRYDDDSGRYGGDNDVYVKEHSYVTENTYGVDDVYYNKRR